MQNIKLHSMLTTESKKYDIKFCSLTRRRTVMKTHVGCKGYSHVSILSLYAATHVRAQNWAFTQDIP